MEAEALRVEAEANQKLLLPHSWFNTAVQGFRVNRLNQEVKVKTGCVKTLVTDSKKLLNSTSYRRIIPQRFIPMHSENWHPNVVTWWQSSRAGLRIGLIKQNLSFVNYKPRPKY